MGKGFKFSLRGKILLINISLVLLLSISVLVSVFFIVSKTVSDSIYNQLNSNINLGYGLLQDKYPGEWRVEGDKLFKGEKCINDDTEFVDEFKAATNSPATIFLGDTRISTNVMKDGKRAVGTKASGEVINTVLKEGKEFTGEAQVVDVKYEAKYVPIKDADGKVIGIWFTGVAKDELNKTMKGIMLIILGITFIVIVISLLISLVFANLINKNVRTILSCFSSISSGDLTVKCEVNSRDEIRDIAENLNQTVGSIKGLIYEIKNKAEDMQQSSESLSAVSEEMAASTENISSAIEDVSRGTGDQAQDLTDITNLLTRFGKELEYIVSAISDINASSNNVGEMANESNKKLELLINSVGNMKSSFNIFNGKILKLGENVSQISTITNLINSIAEQTNLLALNAAIEAARAGESGRGFAVVAEEVRKLAEQSKKSSESINSLLNDISRETDVMVKDSSTMASELNNQMNNINETAISFKEIITNIDEIVPQIQRANSSVVKINKDKNNIISKIEEASSISEEVAASSEEIAASSEQMNASTQEVSAAAQQLSSMTNDMMKQIYKFKL